MVQLRIRLMAIMAGLLLALGIAAPTASAAIPIGVVINGMKVTFPDTQPYLDQNKRTMVPVRVITESLGAKLDWQGSGKMIITYDSNKIELRQNASEAVVNGKSVKLDTPAVQREGRTMVGLRFVSEALGATVRWDGEANTVHITDKTFESGNPSLDAWGRLLRTNKLPGNAGDWAYVLADTPNAVYTMGYRKQLDEGKERVPAAEAFLDPNLNRDTLDKWASKIRHYYDLVFSVDYRTIDPSTWWQAFEPYMNPSTLDSVTRTQYAEWVVSNGIKLEGWAEPEPSMTYWQDGQYVMRTKVTFKIIESDTGYGALLDTFQASYEMKLKKGVWYTGYADVALTTNTSGDPWPHYGVDHHDHLFFTPVGSIQEEVPDVEEIP